MSGPDAFGTNPYFRQREVVGRVVAVLQGVTDHRGLLLHEYRSRAIPQGQIHELMLTDQPAGPGDTVDRVGVVAFFEVVTGGLITIQSEVWIGGRRIAAIAGFDETHMPNHYNICLSSDELSDGKSLDLLVEDEVRIFRPQES